MARIVQKHSESVVRTLFIGEYKHTVDAKGRVSMPAKFRSGEEGESFYVTRGLDGCLFVYSKEEWTKFFDKIIKK